MARSAPRIGITAAVAAAAVAIAVPLTMHFSASPPAAASRTPGDSLAPSVSPTLGAASGAHLVQAVSASIIGTPTSATLAFPQPPSPGDVLLLTYGGADPGAAVEGGQQVGSISTCLGQGQWIKLAGYNDGEGDAEVWEAVNADADRCDSWTVTVDASEPGLSAFATISEWRGLRGYSGDEVTCFSTGSERSRTAHVTPADPAPCDPGGQSGDLFVSSIESGGIPENIGWPLIGVPRPIQGASGAPEVSAYYRSSDDQPHVPAFSTSNGERWEVVTVALPTTAPSPTPQG